YFTCYLLHRDPPSPTLFPYTTLFRSERFKYSEEPNMSSGRIVQIIGAVIDVEFPRDQVPNVYDALKVVGAETTLEVQQQLGDGIVRTIAMGSTEGLKRG